jgi:hypothetical protein
VCRSRDSSCRCWAAPRTVCMRPGAGSGPSLLATSHAPTCRRGARPSRPYRRGAGGDRHASVASANASLWRADGAARQRRQVRGRARRHLTAAQGRRGPLARARGHRRRRSQEVCRRDCNQGPGLGVKVPAAKAQAILKRRMDLFEGVDFSTCSNGARPDASIAVAWVGRSRLACALQSWL